MTDSSARLLGTRNEFVEVRIVEDLEDELTVSLNVRAGIFAAYQELNLPVHTLVEFRDGLAGLSATGTVNGTATLADENGDVSVEVSLMGGVDLPDGPFPRRVVEALARPSLSLRGELRDEYGNELTYGFRLGVDALPAPTAALDAALRSL